MLFRSHLIKLRNIDWRRSAAQWKQRCIRNDGKIMTSNKAINLTAIKIKKEIGVDLSIEEKSMEQQFLSSVII